MNASDIIKAKQSKVLYQAYYNPTLFPYDSKTIINTVPISTISTSGGYNSSIFSCSTSNFLYRCNPTTPSYELADSVNDGKYICGYPYCEAITKWNTGEIITTANCNCKISHLNWKNNILTPIKFYSTTTYSSISTFTSNILSGPTPIICPLINFYQGTNFDNICNTCNTNNGSNNCCN